MRLSRRSLGLAAGASVLAVGRAAAQRRPAWPDQPVRLIVPFAAGGSTDVAARILAERMGQTLGQPVVVENRSGSGGLVGADAVAKAPPDGHVALMATTGLLAIAPHLYPQMPFDPARDFAPVSLAFSTDLVITVTGGLAARSLADFVALAKAQPGKVAYASSGAGTTTHAATELFRLTAGIDLLHVPYRGSGPAMNDLVAGNIQLMVDQIASSIGQIRDGRIRALAVTGASRHPLLPEVPTVAEAGLPGAQASSWGGIVLPARTPAAVVEALHAAVAEAIAQPQVRQRMAQAGADPAASTPEEFIGFIRAEREKWGRVVREAHISVG
ncbi:Bug family tripartite tricarboxylate transporter substrate binding protein [Paracraurococcus ruber]|uniref:ABC transporter substrate-binding protein n=1 Tax=Paracraurococcus ruber TaxID=77675 RepID=A0ABS1D6R0_9PROT|nr:tripartite tricarboxylate transporter substrate binding protein [Paracraurococcus ruber]MBK1662577.1 ABC transporter substrate-binding protein [Paracraurococcus ruber]TDG32031.1 tripartite tricarboxylate transporter substrate binding protein [Paracraurococcus ruber]